ncbi:MAG: hypothetical protein ACO3RG_05585, partial [Nitriliruptoraceae bacterium]
MAQRARGASTARGRASGGASGRRKDSERGKRAERTAAPRRTGREDPGPLGRLARAVGAVARSLDGTDRVALWCEPRIETALGAAGAIAAG